MNTSRAPEWLPSFLIPFFTISYPTDRPATPDSFHNSNYYIVGPLDAFFIVTCIAIMAILRDALRLGVFEPFARWKLTRDLRAKKAKQVKLANGNGHTKTNGNGHVAYANGSAITKQEARKLHRSVLRFAEQGWSFVYYAVQWSYGLYIHCSLPTAVLDPVDAWKNYPHIHLSGPVKIYYLTQCAFYLHQILILNAEARRKDHWQMMAHHIITCTLIAMSYFYNFTRIGCLIMMLMDCSDIFLPLAKMLRYLAWSTLCDATFVCFMVSWLLTRHVAFVYAIKSVYWDTPRMIPRVWDPEKGYFMTKGVYIAFIAMLVSLQIIQIVWFGMICRVAYRVVIGQGAEDTRSDSEDSEDEGKKDQ